MKRKFLEDLGLEKEVIDKILDENSADIGKAKGELDTVKTQLTQAQNELETTKSTLTDRNTQLEQLKTSVGDAETLKRQIAKLQDENAAKDAEMAAEIQKIKHENIDELLLSEHGAINIKAAKALLEILDESDESKYREKRAEQIKALTEAEDSKFLFGSTKITGAEPGDSGDDGGVPDMSKMTYEELASYIENNPDAE